MNLKTWRLDNDLTQKQAADFVGCSRAHWGAVERGDCPINKKYRQALDALLNAPAPEPVAAPAPEPSHAFVSDSTAQIVPYQFGDQQIQAVQADELLMTDRQLGEALGYSQPASAIAHLADRYADELSQHQTIVELTTVDGSKRSVRVWREQGIYLLTMFSAQPKAKAFRQFAAQTLFAVRRQESADGIPTWAAMLLQQMGGNVVQVRQEMAAQQAQIEQVQQAVQAMPDTAADQVIARLQALDTLKGHLHNLVDAIVTRAKELPQSDPFGWQYSQYNRAWRAVHEWAKPQVKSKAEYRTPAQVASAIRGAEMILTKLGGEIPPQPEQLVIDLGVAV